MYTELAPDQIENIKRIAKSEEMKLLVNLLKEKYMISWSLTRIEDAQMREHLYRMIQAIDGLSGEIQNIALNDAIIAHNHRLRIVK